MDKKPLSEVLEQATRFDKTDQRRSLDYLLKVLKPVSADHFVSINKDLLDLKIHLLGTNPLMNLVTMSYYYREFLPNWWTFKEKVRHELVVVRGQTELADALDDLL